MKKTLQTTRMKFETVLTCCLFASFVISFTSCTGSPIQLTQSEGVVAQSPSPTDANQSTEQEVTAAKIPKVRSIDELFLFQPTKYPIGDWEPKFLNFEDVFFESQDGTKIHAWYCPAEDPIAVLLYLHGNGGNLSGRARLMEHLQEEQHVSVMILDYRGYGRSKGKPTVQGVIQDAEAARVQLAALAGVSEDEVVLMGRSLGGALAIQLAARKPPRGLIIESSFSSLKEIAKHHFPKLAWLVPATKLDSQSAIKKCRAPLLISHGNRDRVIPFKMGKELFAAAKEPKQFVVIPNADHNDQQSREYYKLLNDFFKSLPVQDQ